MNQMSPSKTLSAMLKKSTFNEMNISIDEKNPNDQLMANRQLN